MCKNIYLIILLIFTTLFFSCNSDEINLDPQVNTLDAIIDINGEVNLTGSYIPYGDQISEVGFEYAFDTLFNSNKVILTSQINSGNEIKYLLTGVDDDVKYFYKAYVKSSGEYHYGNTKSFLIDLIAPKISSISNDFGHLADTLEIYGKYFQDDDFETTVDISNINAEILFLNDTLIKCKIPTIIRNVVNDVRIKIDDKEDTYSSFTLFQPIIDTIEPKTGVIGDTITLKGDHFDVAYYRNKVFFGSTKSFPIESGRNFIKTIVPDNIEHPSAKILAHAQLQNAINNASEFKLLKPEIQSVSPLYATFREELTIKGNNFDNEISRNKVYFGDVEAYITYADKNTLKVIVPDNLESSLEPIKVVAQLQETIYSENFQLIPPEIHFVPQDVYANKNITINGAYFHPIAAKNIITFENVNANVQSGDTENIVTNIPLGPFPRRKAIVKIQLLDIITTYEIELNILDKWIMLSNNLPFRFHRGMHNAVVANNQAYVIAFSSNINDSELYLWRLNINDLSWEQLSIPFQLKITGVTVSNGDKIYVYNAENDNGFWEFNPLIDQWNQLTDYPGARRDYATRFSIHNDIYIGLGSDFEPYTNINYGDFYRYSPETNSWSQIADFPYEKYFMRTETSSFTINNIAYVGNGASNTGMVDFWTYHPDTNEWIRIADFPDARKYTGSFALNGYGYITGGSLVGGSSRNDCWRYDPSLDNWSQIDNVGSLERRGHFSFSLNGKGYIGGGGISSSGGTDGYDFYEFIPEK